MAKNLLHCETGFGVYRSTQLGHIPLFLLLYLLVGPSIDIVADNNYRGKCDVGGFLIFEWTIVECLSVLKNSYEKFLRRYL
jgi:hypothetical protein